MRSELRKYLSHLRLQTSNHLGYPYNLQPSFKALYPFLEHSINNLGDPFVQSNYRISSRNYEKLVLDWFSDLWKFEKNNYWGYVTSCGTEGNLHSLYVARENLGKNAVLIASDQSHYSIFKAARMFCIPYRKIETFPNGEINYHRFHDAVSTLAHKPLIVNVNLGSTVKGAVDNVKYIQAALNEAKTESVYLHGDAALFGMTLPFLDKNCEIGKTFDAIATSGHKFIGVPFPCGVLMMQKKWIGVLESNVEYLNSIDTTMMGSRNGHAPLFMWHRIQEHNLEGFRFDVLECIHNAAYLCEALREAGAAEAWRNDKSNIVYFTRPKSEAFIRKWQLACEGDIAHVVVMPNVNRGKIKEFVIELKTYGL